ncbi:unnamed protein product [Amoebophrya sp. A120]|nr:unnamed protein product [Amoebophrya sp. A120]|eukprot:GSA120T00002690001.1
MASAISSTSTSPPASLHECTLLELLGCCAHRDLGRVRECWLTLFSAGAEPFVPSPLLLSALTTSAEALTEVISTGFPALENSAQASAADLELMQLWLAEIYRLVVRAACDSITTGSSTTPTLASAQQNKFDHSFVDFEFIPHLTAALHALRTEIFATKTTVVAGESVDDERFLLLFCATACRRHRVARAAQGLNPGRFFYGHANRAWTQSHGVATTLSGKNSLSGPTGGKRTTPLNKHTGTSGLIYVPTIHRPGGILAAPMNLHEQLEFHVRDILACVMYQTSSLWWSTYFLTHVQNAMAISPLDFLFFVLDSPPKKMTPSHHPSTSVAGVAASRSDSSATSAQKVNTIFTKKILQRVMQLVMLFEQTMTGGTTPYEIDRDLYEITLNHASRNCFQFPISRPVCLPIAAYLASRLLDRQNMLTLMPAGLGAEGPTEDEARMQRLHGQSQQHAWNKSDEAGRDYIYNSLLTLGETACATLFNETDESQNSAEATVLYRGLVFGLLGGPATLQILGRHPWQMLVEAGFCVWGVLWPDYAESMRQVGFARQAKQEESFQFFHPELAETFAHLLVQCGPNVEALGLSLRDYAERSPQAEDPWQRKSGFLLVTTVARTALSLVQRQTHTDFGGVHLRALLADCLCFVHQVAGESALLQDYVVLLSNVFHHPIITEKSFELRAIAEKMLLDLFASIAAPNENFGLAPKRRSFALRRLDCFLQILTMNTNPDVIVVDSLPLSHKNKFVMFTEAMGHVFLQIIQNSKPETDMQPVAFRVHCLVGAACRQNNLMLPAQELPLPHAFAEAYIETSIRCLHSFWEDVFEANVVFLVQNHSKLYLDLAVLTARQLGHAKFLTKIVRHWPPMDGHLWEILSRHGFADPKNRTRKNGFEGEHTKNTLPGGGIFYGVGEAVRLQHVPYVMQNYSEATKFQLFRDHLDHGN